MHFPVLSLYLFRTGNSDRSVGLFVSSGREWKMRLRLLGAMAALVGGFVSSSVFAAVISLNTPVAATTGGQTVDAQATFTTSANQIVVVLKNLEADPTSAVQCLSGLTFTIS